MIRILAFLACLVYFSGCAALKKSSKDEVVTVTTSYGAIDLICYDKTPVHKANFIKLAKAGFYNGTTFHRIIDNFMIQGGDPNSKDADPNNDGNGGPGYTLPAEFDPTLTHNPGALAAARLGDEVNPKKESSGSQFYIVENPKGSHYLDQNYTVFGQVLRGQDVVEKIAKAPKNAMDRPEPPIPMQVSVKRMKRKEITKVYGYVYAK